MTIPKWLPHPTAWANAVALYVFAVGVGAGLGVVMPLLVALMRHSPRLACLGMLVVWVAPIAVAAAIHDLVDRVIGRGGSKSPARGAWSGGATSWWAGFVAWVVVIFVTMTTALIFLVFTPPPVDREALWNLTAALTRGVSGFERSAIWIILAAFVYELERAAQRTG